MSEELHDDEENIEFFRPRFGVGEFRWKAASYVKNLILARWKCDPGFISEEELTRWGLGQIALDVLPAGRCMLQAARDLAELNINFIPRCDSGGVRKVQGIDHVENLIGSLVYLANDCYGGVPYNDGLMRAASALRCGKSVDWDSLVNWEFLPSIRDDLDRLPKPRSISDRSASLRTQPLTAETEPFPNTFQLCASVFKIRFAQGQPIAIPVMDGLYYIRKLLSSPGGECSAKDLQAAIAQWKASRRKVNSNEGEGLRSDCCNDDVVMDKMYVLDCKRRLQELAEERRAAQASGDLAEAERLETEFNDIELQLCRGADLTGKSKRLGNASKRVVDRISKAIQRAIKAIGEQNSELGRHLLNAIETGRVCRYSPNSPTDWDC